MIFTTRFQDKELIELPVCLNTIVLSSCPSANSSPDINFSPSNLVAEIESNLYQRKDCPDLSTVLKQSSAGTTAKNLSGVLRHFIV